MTFSWTRYFWNFLLWVDQGGNTLTGGDPDETISSRAAKAKANGSKFGCILCKFLDLFEKDHCAKSIELDEGANAAVS